MSSCCAPDPARGLGESSAGPRPSALRHRSGSALSGHLVELGPAPFTLGDDGPWALPGDGEHQRPGEVGHYAISTTAVSNDEFAAFVEATGYRTDAERFGWSFVFGGLLPDDFPDTRGVAAAPWWRQVEGAWWRHPEGAHSSLDGRGDHPVVHVSWDDAVAYCEWSGGRLPTEAEWEWAARGGTTTTFPWGDELEPEGHHRMNVFQGEFPAVNTLADGWLGTCPVDSFDPNGFGLYNVVGNVWEWTADSFSPGTHVLKGGSYLCHASYCRRYRPTARMGSTPDSSTGNIGFRLAAAVVAPADRAAVGERRSE
jgi:sulfatase modifying factor 1